MHIPRTVFQYKFETPGSFCSSNKTTSEEKPLAEVDSGSASVNPVRRDDEQRFLFADLNLHGTTCRDSGRRRISETLGTMRGILRNVLLLLFVFRCHGSGVSPVLAHGELAASSVSLAVDGCPAKPFF